MLVEPQEDRWAWRRKIRQNPTKLAIYRIAVGIAGLLLVCLGFVSGPIPGPGGIPLVLLGLAIWSSEFKWANRLMQWFRLQLHTYGGWTRRKKVAVLGGVLRLLRSDRLHRHGGRRHPGLGAGPGRRAAGTTSRHLAVRPSGYRSRTVE